jgi:hypothetical protein
MAILADRDEAYLVRLERDLRAEDYATATQAVERRVGVAAATVVGEVVAECPAISQVLVLNDRIGRQGTCG